MNIMNEDPKVSDFIADKPDMPEACAETVEALKEAGPEPASALAPAELERLTNELIGAMKSVYDPEIPVDIYELGLIYKIDVDDDRNVEIDMTLTAPGCPVAGEMPVWVENAATGVQGVSHVKVNLVFDPPWDPSRMSEEAQVALNMF